jgi:hypothetical protein
MKKVLVAILFVASTLCWGSPKPADYTVAVHVQSSHQVSECKGSSSLMRCPIKQHLNAVIDGRKYELNSKDDLDLVLRPGDYKAMLLPDSSPSGAHEYQMEYELLFPDGSTRKYRVVGESE